MKSILCPATPPCSLTMAKKAVSSLPIGLYDETGPLYGMVLPILSSVAVTPGSAAIAFIDRHTASAIPAAVVDHCCIWCFPPWGGFSAGVKQVSKHVIHKAMQCAHKVLQRRNLNALRAR